MGFIFSEHKYTSFNNYYNNLNGTHSVNCNYYILGPRKKRW